MSEVGDIRPEFRVAVFGLATRFQRLLEVVLRHARHNRYRFCLSTTRGPGEFDIALVDMTVAGGPEVAQTLGHVLEKEAVLKVGRRTDPDRPRDDLLQNSFVSQVLFALNRVVDGKLSRRREAEVAAAVASGMVIAEQGERRRPRALVVDDSPTVRRQVSLALHQIGVDSESVGAAAGDAVGDGGDGGVEGGHIYLVTPAKAGVSPLQQNARSRSRPSPG